MQQLFSIEVKLLASISLAFAEVHTKQDCQDGGGDLLFVKLQFGYNALGQASFEGLQVQTDPEFGVEHDFHALCVPRNCAGAEKLVSEHCTSVKGWLTRNLLEAHGEAAQDNLGVDHVFTGNIRQHKWLIDGVPPGDPVPLSLAVPSSSSTDIVLPKKSGTFVGVAVISHHAPLADVFSHHVEQIAARAGIGPVRFTYYSACHSNLLYSSLSVVSISC